ncbi:MAG: 1-acyl-sn-glycerol-3-phosphate acyltransferase [Spirochaetaceae bacterium]|nr:MAG: 1-acyl-sn-glycerol-3-phosphate acyltransferase [Spirochaetaceae bacterium]
MKRHRRRETRAYRWLHDIVRPCIRVPMQWYYRIRPENTDIFRRVRPPYIVIPNHVMTWDPLLVSFYVRDPVHFVASDANFRSSFASWWLRRFGAIAKSKLRDDFGTLRTIMDLLREGKVVGLFAEGERTWDGITLPIIPSTAKLIKAAKVPVIVPVLKGAYHSLPRWAFKSRRGRIEIDYRLALTRDEVLLMSVEEIRVRIEQVMYHDEDAWQSENPTAFTSKRAAEPMQLLLFYCPNCEGLNCMGSKGRRVFCTACGYEVHFSLHGRFLPGRPSESRRVVYETIGAWARAQDSFLDTHLKELVSRADRSPAVEAEDPLGPEVFHDEHVRLSMGYRMVRPAVQAHGRLTLHVRGLKFTSVDGEIIRYPWNLISGLNVVYQAQLEFYHKRRLIVFEFPGRDTSGYKYLLCGCKLMN